MRLVGTQCVGITQKKYYSKRGGEKLIGQNLMDCHNVVSQETMKTYDLWQEDR